MGFAQKLGEFTEGFAGGLLPGLQLGSRIGAARATRTAAVTREKAVATRAERAVIWSIFQAGDPGEAIRRAETMGDTSLATALRRATKGDIKTKFAGAITGADVGPRPTINDFGFSAKGLRSAGVALKKYQKDLTAASGGITTTLAGTPEGEWGVDRAPLTERLRKLEETRAETGRGISAIEMLISQTTNLSYNNPNYEETINGIVDSYVDITGKIEGGNAIRRSLLTEAYEQQSKVWTPILTGLKGDAEGLFAASIDPIVLANPELSKTASFLLSSAKRRAGISPAEQEMYDRDEAQAEMLWNLGLALAVTDPGDARNNFNASINLRKRLGWATETIDGMTESIPGIIQSAKSKDRKDLANALMNGIARVSANTWNPNASAEYIQKIASVYGIAAPKDWNLSTPTGIGIFNEIIDAQVSARQKMINPNDPLTGVSPEIDASQQIVDYLNRGDIETASRIYRGFSSQENIREDDVAGVLSKAKAAGFEWVPGVINEIFEDAKTLGRFKKIDVPTINPGVQTQPAIQESTAQNLITAPPDTSARPDTADTSAFLGNES